MASRPTVKDRGFRLLSALDLVVEGDRRPPGFDGRLAVCVHDASAAVWWVADFGYRATTAFADDLPSETSFVVRLEVRDAEHFMQRGTLPSDMGGISFDGDPAVFEHFIARYLAQHDALSLRVQGRAR